MDIAHLGVQIPIFVGLIWMHAKHGRSEKNLSGTKRSNTKAVPGASRSKAR